MLAYPLPLDAFWDALPVSSLSLDCAPQVETSGTGGGQQLVREVAPALWRGTVTLGRLTRAEALEVQPLIDLVRSPGASFLACDRLRDGPALDPDGAVLGAAAVAVLEVGASLRELRLTGLPPNYPLSRGDLIGVTWGGAPLRYGLHRIVDWPATDAGGQTGWVEVVPALSAGVSAGAPVTLWRPAVKAMVVPGSVRAGELRRGLVEGIAFGFIQTMR